jgi:cysteine desulfurase
MMMLDYNGISVSSGSACSSQLNKPSHVLKAIGLSDTLANETLRISFGKDTRKGDIDYTVKTIRKYIKEQ